MFHPVERLQYMPCTNLNLFLCSVKPCHCQKPLMLDKFGEWVLSGPDGLFFIPKHSQTKLRSAKLNSIWPMTTFSDCWLSQTFWLTLPNQTAAESHCLQTEHIKARLVLPLCHTGTQFKCPLNGIFSRMNHCINELDASQDNLLIQECCYCMFYSIACTCAFPVCLHSRWSDGRIPADGNKQADFLVITLSCRLILLLCYYVSIFI